MSNSSNALSDVKTPDAGQPALPRKRGAYHGPGTQAELKKQRRQDSKLLATACEHAGQVLQCIVTKPWLAHPGGPFAVLRGQLAEIVTRPHVYRLSNNSGVELGACMDTSGVGNEQESMMVQAGSNACPEQSSAASSDPSFVPP